MKSSSLAVMFACLLVPVMVSICSPDAMAQEQVVAVQTGFMCDTMTATDDINSFVSQKDQVAVDKMLQHGQCKRVKAGDKLFYYPFLSPVDRSLRVVRSQGDTNKMHIEKSVIGVK